MKYRFILINIIFIITCSRVFLNKPTKIMEAVVGLQEISFSDPFDKIERQISIWYPVDTQEAGEFSDNPWDVFLVAKNAPLLTSKNKYPAVIISHGYSGHPNDLSWLISGLVKNGFMVIALAHQDRLNGINKWRRARDIKILLDEFEKTSLAAHASKKVGIAGFSLGGTTAIWSIGGQASKLDKIMPTKEYVPEDFFISQKELDSLDKKMMKKDWQDSRIKAAFVMAPAWAWVFDEKSLAKIKIPTYIMATESDQIMISKNNAGFFARNIPNSEYKLILGKAGHFTFITAPNKRERDIIDPNNQLKFLFEDDISVDRKSIQDDVLKEAVKFFKKFL